MKSIFKCALSLAAVLACCMTLTGCLSHWFVDSSSRLQFLNSTAAKTIVGLDVMQQQDTSAFRTWIDETVLPGERSRVHEEDWVGNFKLRIRYTQSPDGSGKESQFVFDTKLDGGSLFLIVQDEGDSLSVYFR